jgi:MFS transporter, DHA1 family, tetracycline resistance protein
MSSDAPAPPAVAPMGRGALSFIFFAVMLDMIAMGIIIPVLPELIRQFVHGDMAATARYIGWFGAIFALVQFVAAPILGGLSDRFGRRPVLLISIFGLGFDYFLLALAPSILWLFLGRVVSGATSATYATANAYIADITPPDQRASRFGVLSAAFGIGFIVGPAIGGVLGEVDPRLPFWAAGGLCIANGLYGLFVLPESLPKTLRRPFSFHISNPVGSFGLYRQVPGLMALAGVVFLYYFAHQVLQNVWIPHGLHRYGWTTQLVGLSMAIVGVGSIAVQVLLVKRSVARLGERGVLFAGLAAGAAGFALFGFAPTGWFFLSVIPIFSLMGLLAPGVQGLMSRAVPADQQGRLQGANMGLMSIAALGGPIFFTEVFARAIGPWKPWAPEGLPFYIASALMLMAMAMAFAARPRAAAGAPAE